MLIRNIIKMAKIICESCKFEFDGNEDSLVKCCPYCGKNGCLDFEQSAEDIMQDIDKFLERI